jgi:hypothetical protein
LAAAPFAVAVPSVVFYDDVNFIKNGYYPTDAVTLQRRLHTGLATRVSAESRR